MDKIPLFQQLKRDLDQLIVNPLTEEYDFLSPGGEPVVDFRIEDVLPDWMEAYNPCCIKPDPDVV